MTRGRGKDLEEFRDALSRLAEIVASPEGRRLLGDDPCGAFVGGLLLGTIAAAASMRQSRAMRAPLKSLASPLRVQRTIPLRRLPTQWEAPRLSDARLLVGVGPAATAAEIRAAVCRRLSAGDGDPIFEARLYSSGLLLIAGSVTQGGGRL